MQQTFSIIKPDAVKRNLVGKILSKLEAGDLKIIASKMLYLTEEMAAGFYAEHKGKPFYDTLIKNMTAGPLIVQVLQGNDAIAINRKIMGTTDPEQAEEGTIRKEFAISTQQNSVHGSDSLASAKREVAYFFTDNEIYGFR